MEKHEIKTLLKNHNEQDVDKYASYCIRLLKDKDKKTGQPKNPWMQKKKPEELAALFERVHHEGLIFDGEDITLQSTGVSYGYNAYKNKMFLAYPESKIDLHLVYTNDEFDFSKESGKVKYLHKISNPFNQRDEDIIGGYCVIKNRRGEFLTLLSKAQIDKHRKVAKTDYVWKAWFPEMCLKTVIKKACKTHFKDVYKNIEEMDNENYDLDKSVDKSEVEELSEQIIEKLEHYQGDDKRDIQKLCAEKKQSGEFTVEFAKNILNQL